jgi:hypothetical protein
MRRVTLALAGAFCVVVSLVVAQGVGAAGATTCTGVFTGTAGDLIVPAGTLCDVSGATISHDINVQANASLFIANSTVGHDISGNKAGEIVTGRTTSGEVGPVKVDHDVTNNGAAASAPGDFPRANSVCSTTIGHDLSITGTVNDTVIVVGDVGPETSSCSFVGLGPNSVGHDVVVAGNQVLGLFGFNSIDVGNNSISHDLDVKNNTAASIDVSDNTVGRDANCSANTPLPGPDGAEDGPNHAGHKNTCG